jgi:sec-independent protein translocase protein TatB
MFANVGWGEMLLLVVVGLVILGPERLPGAIRWTSNTIRQARDYVSGATSQLREDLGPEFDDLRQPLSELQKLRGLTPRAALTKHLLDGDDSWLNEAFQAPAGAAGPATSGAAAEPATSGGEKPHSAPPPAAQPKAVEPLPPGTPAPFDVDAT